MPFSSFRFKIHTLHANIVYVYANRQSQQCSVSVRATCFVSRVYSSRSEWVEFNAPPDTIGHFGGGTAAGRSARRWRCTGDKNFIITVTPLAAHPVGGVSTCGRRCPTSTPTCSNAPVHLFDYDSFRSNVLSRPNNEQRPSDDETECGIGSQKTKVK